MEKFKLGVVGCGSMMENHVRGINQLDCVEITAVCDIQKDRAESVAASLGNNPKIFLDYEEMADAVDGVLIALPHHLHYECGMFFAHNGKHILMEKPLCNSEEECVRLIDYCDEKKVTLMCAYPVRFWPGIVKLKEMVDSGEYGQMFQMSIWTEQLTGLNSSVLNKRRWGRTACLGGGQLFSHGCHYIDLLLWFMGDPVYGTHVGTNLGTPWMLREGTSAVTMKFESGAIAYHGGTWGARGTRLLYDFQIHTEKGMLEYDHFAGEVRLYDSNQNHRPGEESESCQYHVVWSRGSDATKETQHEIRHFVECAQTGKKPLTDGRSALQGLRVIWALYDAEKRGEIADLRGLGFAKD